MSTAMVRHFRINSDQAECRYVMEDDGSITVRIGQAGQNLQEIHLSLEATSLLWTSLSLALFGSLDPRKQST